MKAIRAFCVGVVVLFTMGARAQNQVIETPRFIRATVEQTEKVLVKALESNSPGMQISAALTIRELKALMPSRSFSPFVIPLMRIVKGESETPCTRIAAAIALHELHSARGDYAIARAAELTQCKRMKHMCTWLTYSQLLEDHPELDGKNLSETVETVMAAK